MNFRNIREIIDYYQAPERLKDNIELVTSLIDAQKLMLDMQEEKQILKDKITKLEKEVELLKEYKKYDFADKHQYFIDPSSPDRPLCPICTVKLRAPAPLINGEYCSRCKVSYE